MIRAAIALMLWGLVSMLSGCGPRPGIPIERVRLGPHEITLPGRVDGLGLEPGRTYRLEAAIPLPGYMRGQPLDLSIPLLEAPVTLYVDGVEAPSDGRVSAYREPRPHRFRIPRSATADGSVQLWIDVGHHWAKSGWIPTAPHIVPAGAYDFPAAATWGLNVFSAWLALGVLFQVGVICLFVYVVTGCHHRPYLWFGIQALLGMVYPLFASGMLAGILGPSELAILDLGYVGALLISLRFTHSFLELGRIPRILDLVGVAAAVATVVLLEPCTQAAHAARAVVAAGVICSFYQLWVIGQVIVYRSRDCAGALLLGAGWACLLAGFVGDTYSWFVGAELLGGPRFSCLSMALFAICLSLVLSHNHVTIMSRVDALNAALLRRIDEVEIERTRATELNDELRTQISKRSANLLAALALAENRLDCRGKEITIGMEIDERYRVEAVLGAGAMGTVYQVVHLLDESRWAMKVTSEDQSIALARLAREAHIASQLRDEHVVQIRDIGASSLGFMYIVLELVDGPSLGEQLRDGDRPSPREGVEILRQVASGLAALHSVGIVHRDLKPDNILIAEREGRPLAKITDFGISRVGRHNPNKASLRLRGSQTSGCRDTVRLSNTSEFGDEPNATMARDDAFSDASARVTRQLGRGTRDSELDTPPTGHALTEPGFVVGTPCYIAPELTRPRARLSRSADMFSFGVLAVELLTGELPFPEAVALQLLKGKEIEVSPSVPALPVSEHIETLLWRCLSFDPAQRPAASDLAAALTLRPDPPVCARLTEPLPSPGPAA